MCRDDVPLSDHYKASDEPFAMQSPPSFAERVREPKTANTTPSSHSNDDDPIIIPDKSNLSFTQVLYDTLLSRSSIICVIIHTHAHYIYYLGEAASGVGETAEWYPPEPIEGEGCL